MNLDGRKREMEGKRKYKYIKCTKQYSKKESKGFEENKV